MDFNNYFSYRENDEICLNFKLGSFVTFLGEGKDNFLKKLMFKKENDFITLSFSKVSNKNIAKYKREVTFLTHEHINIFLGETVRDEIAYGMENLGVSRDDMLLKIDLMARKFGISHLLDKDESSLGVSDKVKVKIIGAILCNPKILVFSEVLCELDSGEIDMVVKNLKDFVKKDNIIFNLTSNVNECLFGDEVVILGSNKVLISGKTLNVLNEEVLLKKLGIGLPFLVELNKYLIDYDIIDKYELDMKKLVEEIWK